MNLAEKLPEQKQETPYHIPAMAELEPAMIDLCQKMKDKLLAGAYDYIISDDKTGRIPSLIMKKVMEDLLPEKKIPILHVAAGRRLSWAVRVVTNYGREENQSKLDFKQAEPYYDQTLDAFNKYVKPAVKNKALIITEYIHSGNSVNALKYFLHQARIKFDIASAKAFDSDKVKEPGVELFYSRHHILSDNPLLEHASDYAGVAKGEKFLPFPELWSEVMKTKGKTFTKEQEARLNQAFSLTDEEDSEYINANESRRKEIRKMRDQRWSKVHDQIEEESKNISPEDFQALRQRINQTRSDIKIMAEKIAAEIKNKNNVSRAKQKIKQMAGI